MVSYTTEVASSFPRLNANDHWLRKRQGLALPVLPPTTQEARRFFFSKIQEYADVATSHGKSKINFESFAQEWNRSADGKERFYVTTEVLSAYAKTWEKTSNIRASQEIISDQLKVIKKSRTIFGAESKEFPSFLTSTPAASHPSQGVIELDPGQPVPMSISTELALSHPSILQPSTSTIIPPPTIISPDPLQVETPGPSVADDFPTTSGKNPRCAFLILL